MGLFIWDCRRQAFLASRFRAKRVWSLSSELSEQFLVGVAELEVAGRVHFMRSTCSVVTPSRRYRHLEVFRKPLLLGSMRVLLHQIDLL